MPGIESGTSTRQRAVKLEPPSIITASSSSLGKVLKYPVISEIRNQEGDRRNCLRTDDEKIQRFLQLVRMSAK